MPGLDDAFTSLTGVLAFRNANTKIGPRCGDRRRRSARRTWRRSDPTRSSREGDTDKPTFPTPMQVTLSGAAPADTMVT